MEDCKSLWVESKQMEPSTPAIWSCPQIWSFEPYNFLCKPLKFCAHGGDKANIDVGETFQNRRNIWVSRIFGRLPSTTTFSKQGQL